MTNDEPMPEEAQTLSGALFEGDAATAGKLMKGRQSLTPEVIDLIADLLRGDKAAKTLCSHRLVFKRWPGRPTDAYEQLYQSQERARAINRQVQQGIKVEAALAEISDRTHTPISTLKKDRQRYKRLQPKK